MKIKRDYKVEITHILDRLPEHSLRRMWVVALNEEFVRPVRFWDERDRHKNLSPPDFIKTYYGWDTGNGWNSYGLSLEDIKAQPNLYRAYRKWIKNHPEDDLHLPAERPFPSIGDPEPR